MSPLVNKVAPTGRAWSDSCKDWWGETEEVKAMKVTWGRKALSTAVPVGFSTIVGGILGLALPDVAGAVFGWTVVAVTALLGLGKLEGSATRILFGGRLMFGTETDRLRPAITLLSGDGLGPPAIELRVTGRAKAPAVRAVGRRTVVVSTPLLQAERAGIVSVDEVAALMAHAALTCRTGLARSDCAIAFWTVPWCLASRLVPRFGGLLGFAWRIRAVVMLVAAGRALVDGEPAGIARSAGVVALLGLTYAVPAWARGWQRTIDRLIDPQIIERGLGDHLARYLRRLPAERRQVERIRRLETGSDTPAAVRALRPVPA